MHGPQKRRPTRSGSISSTVRRTNVASISLEPGQGAPGFGNHFRALPKKAGIRLVTATASISVSIRVLTRVVALKTAVVDLGTGSLCPRGDGLRWRDAEMCARLGTQVPVPGRHPFSSLQVCESSC